MSERDYYWFESLWLRVIYNSNHERNIAKLFSISANLPAFQKRFPDTKILYCCILNVFYRSHHGKMV